MSQKQCRSASLCALYCRACVFPMLPQPMMPTFRGMVVPFSRWWHGELQQKGSGIGGEGSGKEKQRPTPYTPFPIPCRCELDQLLLFHVLRAAFHDVLDLGQLHGQRADDLQGHVGKIRDRTERGEV